MQLPFKYQEDYNAYMRVYKSKRRAEVKQRKNIGKFALDQTNRLYQMEK